MNEKNDTSGDFSVEFLPALDEVTYDMSISYNEERYKIKPKKLTKAQKKLLKSKSSEIKIFRFFSYFQVVDSNGEPQYNFDPPLTFRVKYSSDAWEQALENDSTYGRPRIAYLVNKGDDKEDNWADNWVEFSDVQPIYPDPDGDPNGYLVISVTEFEDPAIGGC